MGHMAVKHNNPSRLRQHSFNHIVFRVPIKYQLPSPTTGPMLVAKYDYRFTHLPRFIIPMNRRVLPKSLPIGINTEQSRLRQIHVFYTGPDFSQKTPFSTVSQFSLATLRIWPPTPRNKNMPTRPGKHRVIAGPTKAPNRRLKLLHDLVSFI